MRFDSQVAETAVVKITDISIFYEFTAQGLLRRTEPLELVYRTWSGQRDVRLVCLHSVSGPNAFGESVAQAVDGRFSVVGLDLRGFGSSPRPTNDYTVDLWAGDVVKLLVELGKESKDRLVLYGHGLGACVAAETSRRMPLAGLVLTGVAFGSGEPASLAKVAEVGDTGSDIAGLLAESTGQDDERSLLTPQIVARAIRAWQIFEFLPENLSAGLPTLVVGARNDFLTPLEAHGGGRWFAEGCGARFDVIDSGHEIAREHPAELERSIHQWLEKEVV